MLLHLNLSRSSSNAKVVGRGSQSQDENIIIRFSVMGARYVIILWMHVTYFWFFSPPFPLEVKGPLIQEVWGAL